MTGGRNNYVRAIEQAVARGDGDAAFILTRHLVRTCRWYYGLETPQAVDPDPGIPNIGQDSA